MLSRGGWILPGFCGLTPIFITGDEGCGASHRLNFDTPSLGRVLRGALSAAEQLAVNL